MAVRHIHANERPHDSVNHQPGLMRQHGDHERGLRDSMEEVSTDRAQVAALGDAAPPGNQPVEDRHERRDRDGGEDEQSPRRG